MRTRPAVAVLAVLLAAGCTSHTAAEPAGEPDRPAAAAKQAKRLDAAAIVKKLQAAKLGLTSVAVQDENTDPNNRLGRPGEYTSRASADLPSGDKNGDEFSVERGLVVETFDSPDVAKKRADYIASLKSGSGVLGTEWHYFTKDGTGLVRVGGTVKPSVAKKVQAAVAVI